jgi:hypothetical protein
MKKNKRIKANFPVMFLAAVFFAFNACDEDLKIGSVDESKYETSNDIFGYIISAEGKTSLTTAEFRKEGSVPLFLALTKNTSQAVSAAFKYDKAILEAYNAANETDYELFPESLVTIGNEGAVTISAGEKRSNSVSVSFLSDKSLDPAKSYAIPLSVKSGSGDVVMQNGANYLIFVKDLSQIPDAGKSTGIQIISCMEVNDTNPLNNLCFTLKDSGKPLIDMLILFSGNINYDSETGRVYNYNNPNVQHLLDNREKYLKPLQDRGIKVVLGLLGNHDRSGVANMADETAREFAKEMKAVADAYQLDGFFFDDEYSEYQTPPPTGFVAPSNNAAARLFYEAKKIMPDKLMCAYVYGRTQSFPNPVDGVSAGEFVDWGIHNYFGGSDLSRNYPGLQKSGMALYSQEFNLNYYATKGNLEMLRNNGYGGNMIFAMDPFRSNFSRQLQAMELIARTLFDEDLVYSGKPYEKDW